MKFKAVFLSVLSIVLLTASPEAQTATTAKTKFDASRLTPVKVFSRFDASGKPVLVISGESLALALTKAEATRAVATTVTTNARTLVLPARTTLIGTTEAAPLGRADTLVVTAPATAGSTVPSANPLSASIERQVFVGDLPRDASTASRGLTLGTSAGAAAETVIGPNGFPTFIGTTASGTLPIGPNGFPLLTTTGPQSGIQLINPNGFPATTVPSTAAPAAAGPARASTIVAPNQATAVMSTPATAVGTTAAASQQ
jgi:hypothetical protein